MTQSTIVAEVLVCADCLSLLTNGTISDDLDPAADDAHAARMDAQWPEAEGYEMTVDCPEECEGGFSWSWCGGCGSTLGGDRHPVAVFQTI